MPKILFNPGTVLATADALRALEYNEMTPQTLVARHVRGDWGEIPACDRQRTEMPALARETTLTSRYRLDDGELILVTTDFEAEETIVSQPGDDDLMAVWADQWRGAPQDAEPPVTEHFLVPIPAELPGGYALWH
jgi:hypothetical protein